MSLAKCKKIISIFLYYNNKNEIVKINIKLLKSDDEGAVKPDVMNLARFLNTRRKILIEEKKVGRNNLCPCGSGKKYKHCCGK